MKNELCTTNLVIVFALLSCTNPTNNTTSQPTTKSDRICTDSGCEGIYSGSEFIEGSDVAHQFSNKMSLEVGDKLKELYKKGRYCRVDFSKITMSTVGMGSGQVEYKLSIPFEKVKEKCEAYTSFDHVGGWNHKPALSERKAQLNGAIMDGENLSISELKQTPEGLQEYWIQWRNKVLQAECKE